MKMIKKFAVLASVFALSTASMTSLTSNASTTLRSWTVNNSDTAYKSTSSSMVVKNYSNSYVSLDVSGYNSNGWVDASYYNGQYLKVNGISIPGNSNRRVKQFINENGGTYATVYFYSNSNSGYGEWSPDCSSTCNYTNAN